MPIVSLHAQTTGQRGTENCCPHLPHDPDELNSAVLGEVKNVKSLGWSSQISDFYSYSSARGLEFRLYVRSDTVFRGQLAELYKYNGFTRVDVPGMGP